MIIDILRHGPKNNDPAAHLTGVEALLDPAKLFLIREHAKQLVETTPNGHKIQIITTPVNRAIATGKLEYEVIQRYNPESPEPRIDSLIGSYGIHPETGEAVNLAPRAMSKIWADAKKSENYQGQQGENKPLYAWFEQGLDNHQSWLPDQPKTWNKGDPGISLREIAWRIGAFLYGTLENPDFKTRVVAFGHSGDIETWFALTLLMHKGLDDGISGATTESIKEIFPQIGGALEPLSGATLADYVDAAVPFLKYHKLPETLMDIRPILREQAGLFRTRGLSNQVLMARLNLEKK